jgi:hypothetical protein
VFCSETRDAVPPMWNVRIVSCVPGSPIDCAAMTPTAWPSSTSARWRGRGRSSAAHTPRRAAQVSTERIFTFSMPASCTSDALSSSISSLISTIVSPSLNGSTIRSSVTRPTMRSRSGSMISPDSTMARASMPSSVPQSGSEMMTSCATSTRRRVR